MQEIDYHKWPRPQKYINCETRLNQIMVPRKIYLRPHMDFIDRDLCLHRELAVRQADRESRNHESRGLVFKVIE